MPAERRALRRVAAVGLWGLAAARLVEAVVLRRRAAQLVPLPTSSAGEPDGRPPVLVTVDGRAVDDDTEEAARRVLTGDTAVVDLVPGDLPSVRALRLVRRLDAARARGDALHTPGGAHEAIALRADVADGVQAGGTDLTGAGRDADRGRLVRCTVTAQRYARSPALGRGSDIRVAPALRAAPFTSRDRWRELTELTAFAGADGPLAAALIGAESAHLLALTAGLVVAPGAAVAAIAAWSAQPVLVFGGPRGRGPALQPPRRARESATRLARAWADNVATVVAAVRARRAAAAARPAVPDVPPAPTLFDARRTTCPWCGAGPLVGRLDTTDLLQHKPGRFHLDECRACGHVFQNPALSPAGLDHYYDQFYEGDGEELWEFAFAAMGAAYARRLDVLARFAAPRAWLDVGTGHGHFCLTVRQRWPEAVVSGLDLGESVEEAQRRGWIDHAHRGLFPDLADGLPRSYDVVSMHHYLEHTREPRRELAAAATVLEPGGHLMIEGPDVESPWARWLGRYWRCWFQPQHQHFVTCGNLVGALEDTGFDVVSVERGPATEGFDAASAVTFWANGGAPGPGSRWRPPPTLASRARRVGVLAAAAPMLAVAVLVDLVKDARLRRPGTTAPGNAYRIVARRR